MSRLAPFLTGALIFAGSSAAAQNTPLSGAEINALLSGAVAVGDNWRQTFDAGGQTLYTIDGNDSEGSWRVEGDQYCSLWPPSTTWDCYTMEAGPEADERLVVWIDPSDGRTEARLAEKEN